MHACMQVLLLEYAHYAALIHHVPVGKYLHAFDAQSMTLFHCSYLILEHGSLMTSLQGKARHFSEQIWICNKHLAAFGFTKGGLLRKLRMHSIVLGKAF